MVSPWLWGNNMNNNPNQYKVVSTLPGLIELECTEFHSPEVLPGGYVCNNVHQKIWITDMDMKKMKPGNTVQVS